jgi:hypothetical protein
MDRYLMAYEDLQLRNLKHKCRNHRCYVLNRDNFLSRLCSKTYICCFMEAMIRTIMGCTKYSGITEFGKIRTASCNHVVTFSNLQPKINAYSHFSNKYTVKIIESTAVINFFSNTQESCISLY